MNPTRENLERAHSELAEAEQRLRRIETALERSLSPGIAERREKAERLLAEARNSEPDRWISALVEGGPRPSAVAQAEAALEKIVAEEENHNAQRRMLRAEAQRQHDVVDGARRRYKLEIVAWVAASPEAQALIAELASAEKRIAEILVTAQALPPGSLPIGHRVIPADTSKVDQTLARTWAAALASLEADPNAPLPGAPDG